MQKEVMNIDLGFMPRKFQRECHRDMRRFNCWVVHRRAGKSYGSILKLLDSAIRTRRQNAQYAFIGPFAEQTYNIAWKTLHAKAQLIPGATFEDGKGKGPSTVFLPNKAEIQVVGGAVKPHSKRGTYLDGVILDEVADIPPVLWEEVIKPMLNDAGRQGWAVLQGTPRGINLLSQVYYSAMNDTEWSAKKFTIYDTDTWTPEEIEGIKRQYKDTPDRFAQEYLCDFSAGSNDTLLTETQVTAAMNRVLEPQSYTYAPKTIGVDVARMGDDSTVIFPKQGLYAGWEPIVLFHQDAMSVASKVMEFDAKFKAHTIFIDDTGGYGAGVIDRLRQLGKTNIVGVNSSSKAEDERFENKRMEMWWRGAEAIKNEGLVLANHNRLKLDLCSPRYDYSNARGKMQLESKKDVKGRGMPSPDFADAFLLNFAFRIHEDSKEDAYTQSNTMSHTSDSSWDPFQ